MRWLPERAPLRVVAAKTLYMLALWVGMAISITVVRRLVSAFVPIVGDDGTKTAYLVSLGAAEIFVAIFFAVWMRQVYRSEGGRLAAIVLAGGVVLFGAALAVLVISLP